MDFRGDMDFIRGDMDFRGDIDFEEIQNDVILVVSPNGEDGMVGSHPYAHLSDVDKNLFYAFIYMPHSDFEFDTENWKIISIVEPTGPEDIIEDIEFNNARSYLAFVFELGAMPLRSWRSAVRKGARMLDLGPEYTEHLRTLRRTLRISSYCMKKEETVNWGRDGF